MKKVLSHEVLLVYSDFSKPFVIHTDASDHQLGAVISQEGKPISFFSRKLNSVRRNYMTTEKELLSIVECVKEFRIVLFGYPIRVYLDHKNLVHTVTSSQLQQVMRWRLILEEFGPELIYVPGANNDAADALSCLESSPSSSPPPSEMAEHFGFDDEDLPPDTFPLTYKLLMQHQLQDKELMDKAEANNGYALSIFQGGGKQRTLITKQGKIVIPTKLSNNSTTIKNSKPPPI